MIQSLSLKYDDKLRLILFLNTTSNCVIIGWNDCANRIFALYNFFALKLLFPVANKYLLYLGFDKNVS